MRVLSGEFVVVGGEAGVEFEDLHDLHGSIVADDVLLLGVADLIHGGATVLHLEHLELDGVCGDEAVHVDVGGGLSETADARDGLQKPASRQTERESARHALLYWKRAHLIFERDVAGRFEEADLRKKNVRLWQRARSLFSKEKKKGWMRSLSSGGVLWNVVGHREVESGRSACPRPLSDLPF